MSRRSKRKVTEIVPNRSSDDDDTKTRKREKVTELNDNDEEKELQSATAVIPTPVFIISAGVSSCAFVTSHITIE